MNPDQTLELYKFLGISIPLTVGATTFLIVWLIKRYKYLEKKAVEHSVGATALANVMREYRKVQDDLDNFKRATEGRHDQISDEVSRLAQHVQDFIFQAMRLFQMNPPHNR